VKWLVARELLWLFVILMSVIIFFLLVGFLMGEGLLLYYLQGLWGDGNEANIRESRLMTVIPALIVYGIRLVVKAVKQTSTGRQS
jgi:hypothetical protein